MNISSSIENKIYFSKYKPDSKLGQGSFGTIYSAHNINNGEVFALKLEKRNGNHSLLETETYILCYLKGEGIPYIKSFGFSGEYNVLVMELLGKSLETLFQENNCKFSLKTVCMLAEQMITRLEYIHKKYILHRDIKPDNFTLGKGKKSHIIYLIDFGLSKKYKSSKGNHEHIKYSENKRLIGTARYASINALKGCEQGRRDDMESLGYVLMYFLRGNLPWQGLKVCKGEDRYKKIYEIKKNTPVDELCAGFPKQFCEYVRYTRNLGFEQEPNYDYLKKLIYNVMNKYEYNFDFLFDWGLKKGNAKSEITKSIIINNKSNDENNSNKFINKIETKENNIKKNEKIKENKKQSIININKKNNQTTKKIYKMGNSKFNKTYCERNKVKKNEFNKKIEGIQTKKNKFLNPNKKENNKFKNIRNSEKITKNKNFFGDKDNNVFDKLLNSESYIKDIISFNNQSQDMNLRVSHYKFLSELNSTERKKKEKESRIFLKKHIIPMDYNKMINEKNNDTACFIF